MKYGYARTSTDDQTTALQLAALLALAASLAVAASRRSRVAAKFGALAVLLVAIVAFNALLMLVLGVSGE